MRVGAVYRHFKGGLYEVLHLATLESNLNSVIVYRQLHSGRVWVRPMIEWNQTVEHEGLTTARFTLFDK
jgi:hypothetical protein